MTEYLSRPFHDLDAQMAYTIEVTDEGVTVYSECCASSMSEETIIALKLALDLRHVDRLSRLVR